MARIRNVSRRDDDDAEAKERERERKISWPVIFDVKATMDLLLSANDSHDSSFVSFFFF